MITRLRTSNGTIFTAGDLVDTILVLPTNEVDFKIGSGNSTTYFRYRVSTQFRVTVGEFNRFCNHMEDAPHILRGISWVRLASMITEFLRTTPPPAPPMPIQDPSRIHGTLSSSIDSFTERLLSARVQDFDIDPIPNRRTTISRMTLEEVDELVSNTSNRFFVSNVTLYETKASIKRDECIYIYGLGYFKKDDPRLIPDFANPEVFLILDSQYSNKNIKVYTKIGEDGELIFENNYSLYKNPNSWPSQNDPRKIYNSLPMVMLSNGSFGFICKKLLKNPNFKTYYKESIKNGIFYHVSNLPKDGFVKVIKTTYRPFKSPTGLFLKSVENKPKTYLNTLGKQYTFGIEIETISGFLPEYLDSELFTSAVHDGSLRDPETGNVYGGEYVSDVLEGDQGMSVLKKLCYQLTKRCLVDKKCGVHVHIGNVNFNKENVVLMYYLYQKLQDEVFSMLPISRRKNEYCRYLDPINISIKNILSNRKFFIDLYYNHIISTLSKKDFSNKLINKKRDHPKGFKCGYDHSAARYCWVNFIPAVFDTRKSSKPIKELKGHFTNPIQTIEFRPMQASTSYTKIKSWMLICFGLVSVVENNKQLLYNNPNVSLTDVIKEVYGNKGEDLIKYIEARKQKFKENSEIVEFSDYQDNELDDNFKIISS